MSKIKNLIEELKENEDKTVVLLKEKLKKLRFKCLQKRLDKNYDNRNVRKFS